jgi:iron complex transport system ATP-binding protein
MLLDEPTAFLDLPRRVEIMQLLRDLARETNQAILLSTHDLDLALRLADQVWLLNSDGILKVGAPEDLVLSGAFADTFRSEGVEFDIFSGEFNLHTPFKGEIHVLGEGIATIWTIRALQRVGFKVKQGENLSLNQDGLKTQFIVEVISKSQAVFWQTQAINHHQNFYIHDSLYALIKFLADRNYN